MFNFFKSNEKKIEEVLNEIIPFLKELKFKYSPDKSEIFFKNMYDEEGEAKAVSIIADFYAMAWFFNNKPNKDDFSKLSKIEKQATGVTEILGKKSYGPNPFAYSVDIMLHKKKVNKIFSLESKIVLNLLCKIFYKSDKKSIEIKFDLYNDLVDHGVLSTFIGAQLDHLYKYFYYPEEKEDGLRSITFSYQTSIL